MGSFFVSEEITTTNHQPVNATIPNLSFKIFCSSVLPPTTTEEAA